LMMPIIGKLHHMCHHHHLKLSTNRSLTPSRTRILLWMKWELFLQVQIPYTTSRNRGREDSVFQRFSTNCSMLDQFVAVEIKYRFCLANPSSFSSFLPSSSFLFVFFFSLLSSISEAQLCKWCPASWSMLYLWSYFVQNLSHSKKYERVVDFLAANSMNPG
jgi:hypothetical protein